MRQVAVAVRYVTVTIATTSQALTDRIASSAVITAVDPSGCPTRTDRAPSMDRSQPPSRPGADTALIPGQPDGITACYYGAGFLRQGSSVPAERIAALVAALARVPAGLSRAPANYSHDLCRTDPSSLGTLDGLAAMDSEWSVMTARYPTGRPVTVTIRYAQCGDLGAVNGSYGLQRTNSFIAAVQTWAPFTQGPTDVLPE